jgi:hypothetical protein
MSDTKACRDEDRTGFTAILEDLVERSPGLTGVAFVARDGEAVDYAGRLPSFQLKLAGAHLRIVYGEVDELAAPHFGPVRQVSVRARERSFVVRALPEGYALVLVLARHALEASPRALARAERLIAREVGWPPPVEKRPWHAIDVETAPHDVRRPQRIRAGDAWQPVVILGALVGARRERGYRIRTALGSELTVVREASGHWYSEEAFSA